MIHVNEVGYVFILIFKYEVRSSDLYLLVSLDAIVPQKLNQVVLLDCLFNVLVPFFCCLEVVFFADVSLHSFCNFIIPSLVFLLC